MKLAINHLTRMRNAFICVAGVDQTGTHVRPTVRLPERLPRNLLRDEGGVFELGAVIETGPTTPHPSVPEVEDHFFIAAQTTHIRRLTGEQFWTVLERSAKNGLRDIFGPDIHPQGRTLAVDVGKGLASLGCLHVARAELDIDPWNKIKLDFVVGDLPAHATVTDIRLVEADHQTPKRDAITRLSRLLATEPTILSVGLSRAARVGQDTEQRHWFQINNIHVESDPLGEWR